VVPSAPVLAPGQAAWVDISSTTGLFVNCPTNKTVQCADTWTFDQPTASSCCGNLPGTITNVSIISTGTVTNGVCPQVTITQNWLITDACGESNVCSQTVLVLGCCTNCCAGCVAPYPDSYTVTLYPGTNYVADNLCQGANNTLANVVPNVPDFTIAYFWNQAAQAYSATDQFQFGAWANGTELLSPGEGFVLVNPTGSNFTLTISGCLPNCPLPCSPTNGFWLVGGFGTNTSTYSNLVNSSSSSVLSGTSSTLSSLLASYGSTATTPMIEYQDIGLTLKATPRIMRSGDVSLILDLKIDALSGSSLNAIPILNSRSYSGVVTARLGETIVVAQEISKTQSRAVSGTPGLSDIPGLNKVFSDTDKETDTSTLLIVLTPHVLRFTQSAGHTPMMRVEKIAAIPGK